MFFKPWPKRIGARPQARLGLASDSFRPTLRGFVALKQKHIKTGRIQMHERLLKIRREARKEEELSVRDKRCFSMFLLLCDGSPKGIYGGKPAQRPNQ